jgi:hypothetical protein
MRKIKNKKFDCVEMMHRGAERIREITKDMTEEEELAYWRARTQELIERKKQLTKMRKAS